MQLDGGESGEIENSLEFDFQISNF
jgi:hypothetical protein